MCHPLAEHLRDAEVSLRIHPPLCILSAQSGGGK